MDPFDPKQLIVDLRDRCGIDAERIGELIGITGAQVRSLAIGRRTRLDYVPGRRLVELHAERMVGKSGSSVPSQSRARRK